MSDGVVRVLTLNTGLLRVRLLRWTLLEVRHLEQRLRALPAALDGTGADVLCLQEVFRPRHRDALVQGLRRTHPHAARCDDRRRGMTHGLLVLSRFPLVDVSFTRFDAVQAWQRLLVRQGVLAATVSVPGVGDVRVLDLHTTAGGGGGPEVPRVERLRSRQLHQASQLGLASPLPALLCGDLNAGLEASPRNLRQLLGDGWTDPVAAGTTWNPANPLNSGGLFADSPPQRVDHVLLDQVAGERFRVREAGVVLDRPVVEVPGGRVPLSDHAGVLVALEARSQRSPAEYVLADPHRR